MEKVKRNAVIFIVLLFVGAAVYLNWSYGQKEDVSVPKDAGDKTEVLSGDNASGESGEYFASVRLNRQQARNEASQTLQTVSVTEGIPQEQIDAAAEQMMQIAEWTVKEAELESMIVAKGFADCVVFMTDDGVTVTVAKPEEGLSSSAVAKITDIITSETSYTVDSLKIIEV